VEWTLPSGAARDVVGNDVRGVLDDNIRPRGPDAAAPDFAEEDVVAGVEVVRQCGAVSARPTSASGRAGSGVSLFLTVRYALECVQRLAQRLLTPLRLSGAQLASNECGVFLERKYDTSYATFVVCNVSHALLLSTQQPSSFSRSAPTRFATGTRTCSIASRSRIVTASSSSVSKSTVTQYGVPISS